MMMMIDKNPSEIESMQVPYWEEYELCMAIENVHYFEARKLNQTVLARLAEPKVMKIQPEGDHLTFYRLNVNKDIISLIII